MDLKSMLLPEKTISFEFPGCDGLKIDIAFLSKESNQELYKKCMKSSIDTKTRQPIEKFDDDMFLELYVNSIVKGWTGFKLKFVSELVLANIPEEQQENELPYSEENALELMKNSSIFDAWVSEVISDLGNFTNSSTKKKSEE